MREIRFRAWDKIHKRMFDVKEIIWIDNQPCYVRKDEFCLGIKDCILVEYTGLEDRNGKGIYEGDIAKTFRRIGRGFREMPLEAVRFSPITARWYPLNIVVTEMAEVIGNIYENGDLLNG